MRTAGGAGALSEGGRARERSETERTSWESETGPAESQSEVGPVGPFPRWGSPGPRESGIARQPTHSRPPPQSRSRTRRRRGAGASQVSSRCRNNPRPARPRRRPGLLRLSGIGPLSVVFPAALASSSNHCACHGDLLTAAISGRGCSYRPRFFLQIQGPFSDGNARNHIQSARVHVIVHESCARCVRRPQLSSAASKFIFSSNLICDGGVGTNHHNRLSRPDSAARDDHRDEQDDNENPPSGLKTLNTVRMPLFAHVLNV